MRLWSEERRGGTIELLLTLPITIPQAVLGKFLAAWAFRGFALSLTFPLWLTVKYLGDPDNGVAPPESDGAAHLTVSPPEISSRRSRRMPPDHRQGIFGLRCRAGWLTASP